MSAGVHNDATQKQGVTPLSTVVDYQSPMEYAEAGHFDRWTRLVEQYPDGKRFELWVDRDAVEPFAFCAVTKDHVTRAYSGTLSRLMGANVVADLRGAKRIRIRSTGCPNVTADMDERFVLNYGAAGGILRFRVGTHNRQESKSNFWTSVVLSPPDGEPVYDQGTLVTRLPCKPPRGASVELSEIANNAVLRGVPCAVDLE
jgi:hypothetical protein